MRNVFCRGGSRKCISTAHFDFIARGLNYRARSFNKIEIAHYSVANSPIFCSTFKKKLAGFGRIKMKGYLSFQWTSYLSCVRVKGIRMGEGRGLKKFCHIRR